MPSSEKLPKIAIFGLGAITITLARAMSQTKTPFSILCRNEDRKLDLANHPIQFKYKSNAVETLPFYELAETVSASKETFDYIFIGAKNAELRWAIASVSAKLKTNGKVILIQNGFPEKNAGLTDEQIIGGVVGWNTQKLKSGIFFQSNIGSLILGGADQTIPPSFFESIFGPLIPVIRTENLAGYRWHKLGINSVINGLSASCMLSLGALMLNKNGRKSAIRILTEVRRTMEKVGVKEEVVPGSISICKLGDGEGALPVWIRHLNLIVLGLKYFKIRTSMVQDLDHNRTTEIDDLNGAVVQYARSLNLVAPVNEAVQGRVKELEQKKAKPDLTFLEELLMLKD